MSTTLTVNGRNFLVGGVTSIASVEIPLGVGLALAENIVDAIDAGSTDAATALAAAEAAQADATDAIADAAAAQADATTAIADAATAQADATTALSDAAAAQADATTAIADAATAQAAADAAQADVDAIVPGVVASFAVAGVPDATLAGNLGRLIWVTNGNAGVACPAISDGTNWKVIALGATISAT